MKYITKILGIACLALSFYACSEDSLEVWQQPQQYADDVSYSINFSLQLQEPVTRSSYVYGEDGDKEKGVQSMQLLCFDASGLYLGIRDAVIGAEAGDTSEDTKYRGKFKGTVPQGTARIHFVANRSLSIPLDFSVGTPEEDVMKSETLSTLYGFEHICYWGYKSFSSADAMNTWLKGEGADNTVYMIRDRAKIKLTLNKLDQIIKNATVTDVRWRIHNGHTSGYIAPQKMDWANYTKTTGSKTVSNAKSNFNSSVRYKIHGEESLADPYTVPQYLFDDDNEPGSDFSGAVKVILSVTYTTSENDTDTKYFAILIKGDQDQYIDIIRNYVYNLKVTTLDMDVAYDTWDAAVDGTKFANGEVDISRDITDVNNDTYSLQIKLPTETTSIVLNMVTPEGDEPNKQIKFAIGKLISSAENPALGDVHIHWENGISPDATNGGISGQSGEDNKYVTLGETTVDGGTFTIPVTVNKLPTDLKSDWLVVEFTKDGKTLRRYIHVFVINQFQFLVKPTLKAVPGRNGEYVLNFTIPKDELTQDQIEHPENYSADDLRLYPKGLYPIDVMFATNTLKAWSIDGSTPNYGLFGVSKESTSIYEDKVTKLKYDLFNKSAFESDAYTQVSSNNATTDRSNWWYQQYNTTTNQGAWDFWYTYSIKQYPTNGVVNIYFKDVTGNLNYTTTHSNVGLYLYIRYFGKIYAMTVARPTN